MNSLILVFAAVYHTCPISSHIQWTCVILHSGLSIFFKWTSTSTIYRQYFLLKFEHFYEYLIQHYLKSGGTKDHFKQVEVPGIVLYWKSCTPNIKVTCMWVSNLILLKKGGILVTKWQWLLIFYHKPNSPIIYQVWATFSIKSEEIFSITVFFSTNLPCIIMWYLISIL
jgi:hypothetical protein